MKLEETSENMIHFKVRTFVALVGGLILGTNIVNSVLHDIAAQEKEDIRLQTEMDYNVEAEKRRRAHSEEKMLYELTIKELSKELKDCEEK